MERPLYSEIAERAVLGSALLDNSLMRGPLAELAVRDFSKVHGEIYSEMLKLSEDGIAFDCTAIALAFEDRDLHGMIYSIIVDLVVGAVPHPAVLAPHVKRILSLSKLRKLLRLSEHIVNSVENGTPPEEIEADVVKKVQFLQSGCDLNGDLLPASRTDERPSRTLTAIGAGELLTIEIKLRGTVQFRKGRRRNQNVDRSASRHELLAES